ncbi:hypothetical protein [Bacillus sp. V2I10]|uniref:hypothetical protein n=1 Tax=Bacillus sp. V2I10 TaxID=3042276 RepID=UPI0027843EA7|nr:hypothetical protein [Bacillus sp. V2I10]MDQ0859410.1 hypothetical protein [Bacillus sp. V2I10]
MKIIVQAIIGSLIIHMVYFISTMIIGYIKTKRYVTDIESAWDNAGTLQNKVSFGSTISPGFYLVSFVGVTVICGLIILLKNSFI